MGEKRRRGERRLEESFCMNTRWCHAPKIQAHCRSLPRHKELTPTNQIHLQESSPLSYTTALLIRHLKTIACTLISPIHIYTYIHIYIQGFNHNFVFQMPVTDGTKLSSIKYCQQQLGFHSFFAVPPTHPKKGCQVIEQLKHDRK